MWWGFKFLAFYLAIIVLSVALAIALRVIRREKEIASASQARVKITGREMVPVTLGVSLLMVAYLDRRPMVSLGLHFYSSWVQELLLGTIIGCIMVLVAVGVIYVLSHQVRLMMPSPRSLGNMLRHLWGVVGEELISRGYPLQVLVNGIGMWPAVGVTSALFGLLHYQRLGWLGVIDSGLFGLLLSLAIVKTKALWMAIGIHFGWNFFEALLMRPGEEKDHLLLIVNIIVTAVFLLVILWLPLQPHPEMERVWHEYIQSTR
jgi:membrane protease YdiL (CAAX protease family)